MNPESNLILDFVRQCEQELDLFHSGLNYHFLINVDGWLALTNDAPAHLAETYMSAHGTIMGHPFQRCNSRHTVQLSILTKGI